MATPRWESSAMTDDIVVIGGGGFGRETLDVIEAINALSETPLWRVIGVADDSPEPIQLDRLRERGYEHLGSAASVRARNAASYYVVGIGSPSARARIAGDFDRAGWKAAILVHPSATVGSSVSIAEGVVICGGVQLSTNTRLGEHVHLNPGSIVGHDSALSEFVSVNPGAVVSGEVTVHAGALIGAGAVVLQGLTVGAGAVVGAAACVVRTVPDHDTVVGVPARSSERRGAE